MTDALPDALSAAFPWLQEASDIDPRHLALRPIAWEHTEACDCRVCKIRRAAERARANASATTETSR